jgi:hypothetical protein
MLKLRRLLDKVLGERTPEGVDEKFWKTRHEYKHQPFDDRYSHRGHLLWKGCRVPPDGWYCSREQGHDGPCTARPTK